MNKCLGCGITLQDKDKDTLGYTENLENTLCERCFKLKNYGEYSTVSLNNQDYQKIIKNISPTSLVVYVSDILFLNLKEIPKFPNLLLVLTKRDLLPKSVKEEKIIQNIKNKFPNLLDIICISSMKNYHLDILYDKIKKYAHTKEVYLIGNTNSGKSTLMNKLIANYDNEDQKPTITVSMYPSTTLDKVEIKLGELTLIDTPGLIEEGNLINIVSKQELKQLTPKKEIKPKSCQVTGTGSILIGTFARIDYKTKQPNSFVIYTANSINTNFISEKNNVLKNQNLHKYFLTEKQDIVIPGLGFIKFTHEIEVTIYTQKNVKLYTRNNLI